MQILDGCLVAQKMKLDLQKRVRFFCEKNKKPPGLRVILVGDNLASQVYVRQKIKSAKQVGIDSKVLAFPANVSFKELKQTIQDFNQDSTVHAVLVQLPLPSALPWKEVISQIEPKKDPDGLTAENQGLAWLGCPRILPCTPEGIIRLLEHYNIELAGKKAVVVGRSQIVGLPMVQLLLRANATVTVCHSHTKKLLQITRRADIVVSAAGQPEFLGGKDFKEGAVVVDVGIHRVPTEHIPTDGIHKSKLVGDVRFKELKHRVAFATPVPGGVGPMTVAMLLENTVKLAYLNTEI